MIIDVPFKYTANGVEPRKRNPHDSTGYDQVRINIRDIHETDAPVALELLDEDGGPAETFRHFEGGFWIRNSREDECDFSKQHMMLLGHWPLKSKVAPNYGEGRRNFRPYTRADADRDTAKALKGLSLVGFLRSQTTGKSIWHMLDHDLQPDAPFYQGPGGIDCAVVDAEASFRDINRNNINDRRQETVEYAQANVVAINGEIWHRAPVPMIYATDKQITWAFDGTIGGNKLTDDRYGYMNDKADMFIADAYKMAMTDYDTIPEHFPDAIEKQKVKFHIRFIDPDLFASPDLRPLILKDIDTAWLKCDVRSDSQSYIVKWLQFRDLVKPVRRQLDSQNDDFFDTVAEIMLELDAMVGMSRFPGAAMWLNRQVDLGLPATTDQKPQF
jgi:hypothetical protein